MSDFIHACRSGWLRKSWLIVVGDVWQVRLSASAKLDCRLILRQSMAMFGLAQAQVHADTLVFALNDLSGGPDIVGVKDRDDIGANIKALHVARKGRKGLARCYRPAE